MSRKTFFLLFFEFFQLRLSHTFPVRDLEGNHSIFWSQNGAKTSESFGTLALRYKILHKVENRL